MCYLTVYLIKANSYHLLFAHIGSMIWLLSELKMKTKDRFYKTEALQYLEVQDDKIRSMQRQIDILRGNIAQDIGEIKGRLDHITDLLLQHDKA